jgi:glycosyltransferase involved in cell wall biosynthesis
VRILFLSPRQCWPPQSGAKLREYYFLRALSQIAQVTYVHFTEPRSQPLTKKELPFCAEVVAVPKPKTYGAWNLLRGLVGRWPVSLLNYESPEMAAALRALEPVKFDLIHLDSIHMLPYERELRAGSGGRSRIVYNWHNIESEAMRRYREASPSAARSWYAGITAGKLEALELQILKTSLGHIVCSQRERQQLTQLAPDARIAVVENGVDSSRFRLTHASKHNGRLLFVGLMNYHPNIEAAISFAQSIWPKIHERSPELTFWIVGANPSPEVAGLAKIPGVHVTGTVPEVQPFYQDAVAAVVPLRTGAGTRLKILEAMAAGMPVISTPLGAEGLEVEPGKNILFAGPDDAKAWIQHVSTLAENPEERRKLVEAALHLARTRYDWGMLGNELCRIYQMWLDGRNC